MRIRSRRTSAFAILVLAAVVLTAPVFRSAETLPAQLTDSEYWQMISGFSEPSGYFQYEIITSNEISYQQVLPNLMRTPRTGGAYLGVGPEQNFTYIAALKPKIAFIFDIRRDMMLEHLMYKSIFEVSASRVEFASNLFSRKVPAQLTADSSIEAILRALAGVSVDPALVEQHTKEILDRLKTRHHFPLTAEDERGIRAIYRNFAREGVLSFNSSFRSPGYAALMTLTDGSGKNWSYLATRENYDRVRTLQQENLIVPIVGDFAGPKAIRAVGQYLKEHGTIVHAFYISNVEDYIRAWGQYVANVSSLPTDPSSVLIRWTTAGFTSLSSMPDFVRSQRIFR